MTNSETTFGNASASVVTAQAGGFFGSTSIKRSESTPVWKAVSAPKLFGPGTFTEYSNEHTNKKTGEVEISRSLLIKELATNADGSPMLNKEGEQIEWTFFPAFHKGTIHGQESYNLVQCVATRSYKGEFGSIEQGETTVRVFNV